MPPLSFLLWFHLLFVIPQAAHIIAFGNGFGQLQFTAIGLSDALVAAHGNVTQQGNLFVCAASFLSPFDQGTIVKVQRQFIVRTVFDFHLKYPLCGLGEQCFAQTL